MLGGDHGGAGQLGLTDDFRQAQLAHQRHEDEQAAEPGAESAWLQIEGAHIGNGGSIGHCGKGPFQELASCRRQKLSSRR